MPPDFNLTSNTLEAIQRLVLLGFPEHRFPELHQGRVALVTHYQDARDKPTGVYGRGGNQATAERLWNLMRSAQAAFDAADPRPLPSALPVRLLERLTPWSTSEVRTVHRLDSDTWTDLIAAALGVRRTPQAGRPPIRRTTTPLPAPGRPAPLAGHGLAADTRSGFYVVELLNWQPMLSQEHDPRSIQVCRGWVKVGKADSFARRLGDYEGTFTRGNVRFRPIATMAEADLKTADALVKAAHLPWRRRNPPTDSRTEWMNGVCVKEAVEEALKALKPLQHVVLWDGG